MCSSWIAQYLLQTTLPLQDFSPNPPPPDANTLALTGVSYIGIILSVIGLTIAIITYVAEK